MDKKSKQDQRKICNKGEPNNSLVYKLPVTNSYLFYFKQKMVNFILSVLVLCHY